MNSKERIEKTFQGESTDLIPVHHLGFCSQVASALLGREAYVGGGIQQWREVRALWNGPDAHQEFIERSFQDALDIALYSKQDIIRILYWRYPKRPTKKIDELTYLFGDLEEQYSVLQFDPQSEECVISDYGKAKLDTLSELEKKVEEIEERAYNYTPDRQAFDLEIRCQQLMGSTHVVRVDGASISIPLEPTIWLEATLLRPDLVGRFLDAEVLRAQRNILFLSTYGFHIFFGGGDFASNQGPMYSKRVFRQLLLPRLKTIVDYCHTLNGRYLFASDGNLWAVADELFGESGIDGYYEIDRHAGMDLEKIRDRFPYLTLIGNISSQTVHLGSKTDIRIEVLSCIETAKQKQGIIVGSSNYFVPGTPIDHVKEVIETIEKYR